MGYPKGLVEKEMGKVKFSGYTRRNKREKKGVPFAITYCTSLKNIGKIINQNLYILQLTLSNSNLKGEKFLFELERDSNYRKSL